MKKEPQIKIKTINELASILEDLRKKGKRIAHCHGCFDLLHPGHIRYLQAAAKLGDHLLIAVNTDDSVRRLKGTNRPLNKTADRMEVLSALACVTWVTEFSEDTPQRIISEITTRL